MNQKLFPALCRQNGLCQILASLSVIYCLMQFSVSIYENGKHSWSNGTEDRNTDVVWSVWAATHLSSFSTLFDTKTCWIARGEDAGLQQQPANGGSCQPVADVCTGTALSPTQQAWSPSKSQITSAQGINSKVPSLVYGFHDSFTVLYLYFCSDS